MEEKMKDFIGNEIKIGDTVAVIFHPEAYVFSIEKATILEIKGKQNMIVTRIDGSEATVGFLPDSSGELYRKVVRITPVTANGQDYTIDAIGQPIQVGNTIACIGPNELGNTIKGFVPGGKVIRITEHFVFYKEHETGETKRKGFNKVVVIY